MEGNPNAAVAWSWLSYLLYNASRTAEGKLAALKSYEADPYLSTARTTLWRLFQTSFDLEDADESRRWCSEGQRRFPESYRFTECQIWLFGLPNTPPDVPKMWQLQDQYLKQRPAAGPEFSKRYGEMLIAIGLARAGLGDSARTAMAKGETWWLKDLRSDPRWRSLVGLPATGS